MSNLLIFLIILILEAEARAPKNDLPHRQKLIIDRIYNSTHYYEKLESILGQYNDTRDNNVTNPLLVGFARHPYEYSVPADEYLKGMKEMEMDPEINTNTTGNRSKRNIIQLYNMISCATGCDPLSYNNYGCYCGFLGGGTPVNLIDRCCQAHDDCYDRAGTSFLGMYLLPYFWQCNYGYPRCDTANYHPWVKFFIGNAGRLCECDRRFAMCLSRYYCPRRKPACLS